MTALEEDVKQERAPWPAPALCWFGSVAAWFLLAAGLVFCHGCHAGDHDDELSVPLPSERR